MSAGAGVCRSCGCTDLEPCVLDQAGELVDVLDADGPLPDGFSTCSWIEPDLCSGCVTPAPPLLVDVNGNPMRRGSP